MSKHTPAPWGIIDYPDGHAFIKGGPDNSFVANVSGKNYEWNRVLIGAAPDLLEALQRVMDWLSHVPPSTIVVPRLIGEAARAAIAKASSEGA